MKALIEFMGRQRVVTETDSVEVPLTEKTSVKDALDYVNREYPSLGLDIDNIVITVNGDSVPPDRTLKDNDTVLFLPVIGGG